MRTLCVLTVATAILFLSLLSWCRAADIGVEGVKHFSEHNRALGEDLGTLYYTYDICDGLWDKLDTGDAHNFHFHRTACWEKDVRDLAQGGLDSSYADNVDLFFIATHGGNWGDSIRLAYDTAQEWWHSDSARWKLGDGDLEWLCLYSCSTLPLTALWNTCNQFFYGLHMVCGAHDVMWYGPTTDEVGEDFGQNLKDGDLVVDAWLDGTSDWFFDQNPLVVSAERYSADRGGGVDWANLVISRDHYPGHGHVCLDIPHGQIDFFAYVWID